MARNVARGHDQREAERRLAVAERQWTDERQADRRLLARHQIADAQREDVRPFLLGDRRPMTSLDGLLVLLPRLGSFLKDALDNPAGHLHAEARDRGPV